MFHCYTYPDKEKQTLGLFGPSNLQDQRLQEQELAYVTYTLGTLILPTNSHVGPVFESASQPGRGLKKGRWKKLLQSRYNK